MRKPVRVWMLAILGLIFWQQIAFGGAGSVRAQNPGPGTLVLDSPWQFHVGDDPRWSSPELDDADWTGLKPTDTWGDQGFPGYTGYAWYRQHLAIAGSSPALSLLIPVIDDNYAVYWNGREIGVYGGFPPHAMLFDEGHGAIFDLPEDGEPARPGLSHQPDALTGVLAIRVWKSQLSSLDPDTLGGFEEPPLVGARSTLKDLLDARQAAQDHLFRSREMFSSVVVAFGFASLLLYFRGNRDAILLWLAIYLIVDGASAIQVNLFRYQAGLVAEQLINAIRASASHLAVYAILLLLFGMGSDARWRRRTIAVAGLDALAELIDTVVLAFWQFPHAALRWIDGVTSVVYSLLPVYVFFLIAAGLRRGRPRRLWPLILATSAHSLYNLLFDLSTQGVRFTGFTLGRHLNAFAVPFFGYPVGLRTLLDLLFLVALVWTVSQQQARERLRRAFLELEIKSAQEIQQVLVPNALPDVPGFAITAAYRPAQEVGGDFFQILPTSERGLLLVIGDVSGKGLKAAMTVSLIVGMLRTLSEVSESPAAILNGLNRLLCGRMPGGFVTCLAMQIREDGACLVANAGHLSPFRNEKEFVLDGSIPLGLDEELVYEETGFSLARGDRLTVFTDGLPEARAAGGELFGFSRVEGLLRQLPTMDRVLQEACAFGQDDDITLLSLTRT